MPATVTTLLDGGVAQLQVARLPRTAFLVLREAEAVTAGGRQGGLVHFPGHQASDVSDDQPQGPSNGRVGTEPGTKTGGVAVDSQFPGDWTVDDYDLCGPAGGGSVPAEVEFVMKRRLDGRHHHGEIFGNAAGHYRIYRHLLQGCPGVSGLHGPQRLAGVFAVGRQHLPDQGLGGRRHRQAVGPSLLPAVVLHRLKRVRHPHPAGLKGRWAMTS